jgi:hypothetical protein
VYSPRLRTALVFDGSGTAGAYQAGVVKALAEAGVKIDVVAGHGAGAMTALSAAIDGALALSGRTSPWLGDRVRRAYRWRPALKLAAIGMLLALSMLLAPLVVLGGAAVVYGAALATSLAGRTDWTAQLVAAYQSAAQWVFEPAVMPTVVPRLVVGALLVVAAVLVVTAVKAARQDRSRRRFAGTFWWRLLGSPLSSAEPGGAAVDALWQMVRGASNAPLPVSAEVGRRYVETLSDNLGQPGFRELLVAVHDVDAGCDLVGAVVAPGARGAFAARRPAGGPREAETLDLAGPARELVVDLLIGACRLPVVTAPHPILFAPESYWRGELHHVCDRPGLSTRLVEELAGVGVEQAVIVSAAPRPAGPHSLRRRPGGLRARMGAVLRSIEAAAVDDAALVASRRLSGAFVIRPEHNPIGPFEFEGTYDESSDRRSTVQALIDQGYDDAYRQFIEPIVASGDRLDV